MYLEFSFMLWFPFFSSISFVIFSPLQQHGEVEGQIRDGNTTGRSCSFLKPSEHERLPLLCVRFATKSCLPPIHPSALLLLLLLCCASSSSIPPLLGLHLLPASATAAGQHPKGRSRRCPQDDFTQRLLLLAPAVRSALLCSALLTAECRSSADNFFSYTVTEDEISLIADEDTLARFPSDALVLSPDHLRAIQVYEGAQAISAASPSALPSPSRVHAA